MIERGSEPALSGSVITSYSIHYTKLYDAPGSDPRAIKTTARRDGDEWVINGHKWFTSNGLRADFLIVMCRIT